MSNQPNQDFYADDRGWMVSLLSEDDGVTSFAPQGGGFVRKMNSQDFHRSFKPCELPPYRQVSVTVEGLGDDGLGFVAYSNGRRWNGWAMPHFPLHSALAVAQAMGDVRYDEARDVFILETQGDEPEEFAAEVIQVDGEGVKVYPIGAGYWCWDVVPDAPQAPVMRP